MITPSFSLTATERVLPRLALDWTTGVAQPGVDVSRAGVATFVGSDGLIQSATADTQRIDYFSGIPGLLVEESRTNICLQSQDLSTTWSAISGTVNTDQAISPDGTQNADEIVAPNGSAATVAQTISTTTTAYGWSVFAKSNGLNTLRLYSRFNPQADVAIFNLSTVTATVGAGGTSAKIEDYGNGWYRCSAVFTPTLASATNSYRFITEVGDGTSGIFVWRSQIEAGAFATSYIPTVASQVTRNADVATMTGTNFSDWYNASEGTLSAKGMGGAATVPAFVSVDDNTTSNRICLRRTGANTNSNIRAVGNGYSTDASSATALIDNSACIVYAYKNASQYAASNKSNFSPAVSSVALIPTAVTQLTLGNSPGSNYLNGHLQRVLYWPLQLTQNEVQAFSN